MPLTDEQIDKVIEPWDEGKYTDRRHLYRDFYRLGLLRAAIICERIDREDDTGYAVVGECAQAIRAEAEKC